MSRTSKGQINKTVITWSYIWSIHDTTCHQYSLIMLVQNTMVIYSLYCDLTKIETLYWFTSHF